MQDDLAPATVPDPTPLDVDVPFATLTARERQVAVMLARAMKNDEIAEALEVTIKTIDTHRSHVMQKLGLRNNSELVHVAIARGWVAAQLFGVFGTAGGQS